VSTEEQIAPLLSDSSTLILTLYVVIMGIHSEGPRGCVMRFSGFMRYSGPCMVLKFIGTAAKAHPRAML
jgi:hypothetical protein